MSAPEPMPVVDLLRSQCDAIAAQWYHAIRHTSFVPFDTPLVRARLVVLMDQTITLLLAERLDGLAAQAIGCGLVQLHYRHPAALRGTLVVLSRDLVAGLPAALQAELQPRLAAVIGDVAAGFYAAAQVAMHAEQEAIRSVLLTERHQAIAALRQSEARLRAIFMSAAVGIALVDMQGRLVTSNPALQRMLGYTEVDLQGLRFIDITHPDDVQADWELFSAVGTGQRASYQIEKRYLRKDGQVVGGRLTVSLIPSSDGDPHFVLGIVEDITEAKQGAADLAAARRQLVAQEEMTWRHFTQELHDGVVQQLVGINSLLAVEAKRLRTVTHPDLRQNLASAVALDDIRQELPALIAQIRDLIGAIRPAGLQELGLTAALTGYVYNLKRQAHAAALQIDVDLDPIGPNLPYPIALGLFRIAQEALRNVLRHAHARRVTVSLRMHTDDVALTVRDDGQGFSIPARLSTLARGKHYGLVTIKERVAWVGGHFHLQSWVGGGTELIVHVPLREGADHD